MNLAIAVLTDYKTKAGDLNFDRQTGATDFFLLRTVFHTAGLTVSQQNLKSLKIVVPEPSAEWIMFLLCVIASLVSARSHTL